jgi:HlyD family secretion protein
MNSTSGRTAFFAVVAAITLLSGTFAWQNSRSPPLPAGFVVGGGRLESVEIDVTTKAAGRIKEILVKKGERVDPGQVVARMDTQPLEAELQQLQSRVKQTGSSPVGIAMAPQKTEDRSGARAVLAQKRQAKAAAMASMTLIESEAAFAESELKRSEELVAKGFLTAPRLQADRSRAETAKVRAERRQIETGRGPSRD